MRTGNLMLGCSQEEYSHYGRVLCRWEYYLRSTWVLGLFQDPHVLHHHVHQADARLNLGTGRAFTNV